MNHKLILSTMLTAAVLSSSAMAMSGDANTRGDLYGDPAPTSAATRIVYIAPDTRNVNINGGETVAFVEGGKSFAWHFDGPTQGYAFDLKKVAPEGMLEHKVQAYVDADPNYGSP